MDRINYHRMTIRPDGSQFQVYKVKPRHDYAGAVSGGGFRRTTWFISGAAQPLFTGTLDQCAAWITEQGAELEESAN